MSQMVKHPTNPKDLNNLNQDAPNHHIPYHPTPLKHLHIMSYHHVYSISQTLKSNLDLLLYNAQYPNKINPDLVLYLSITYIYLVYQYLYKIYFHHTHQQPHHLLLYQFRPLPFLFFKPYSLTYQYQPYFYPPIYEHDIII